MSKPTFNILKTNIYHPFKFRYPSCSIINNIKINNLNIFSKIITNNKILIYGNYDITITYNNMICNRYITKDIYKYKKLTFFKVLNCNLSKHGPIADLKSTVELFTRPLSLYSLRKPPCYFLKNQNFCQIILFLSVSVNLYRDNSSYKHDRTSDKNNVASSENKSYLDIAGNTSTKYNTTSGANKDKLYKNIYDNTTLSDDNPISKITTLSENNTSNSAIEKTINNYHFDNTLDILSNSTNNSDLYYPKCNCHNTKKKLIRGNAIIGRGYAEVFIEKILSLSDPINPIWKITSVNATAEVTKIDLIGEKAFASGFSYIDVNYNTLTSSATDFEGSRSYVNLTVPFSICIDITSDTKDEIKSTDDCQVNNIYVSEIHKLTKPTSIKNEIIYNELTERFIVQVSALVTRTIDFYI